MQFDPNIDYYKALGVNEKASADEIKKAYRRLAKQYHPDSTGGDKAKESRFKEISTAYDVLGNTERRQQYDAFRAGPTTPFGSFGDGGGSGFGFDLGDLFSQVFSGGAPGGQGAPGGVHYSFYSGAGPGFDFEREPGPRRGRSGRRRRTRRQPTAPAERKVRAADGSPLVRRGDHIYSDVRVGIDQAILGAVVDVPTLTGVASVKIPPGTSSGAKLRLKGKGARSAGGAAGDHYVTVQIDVPKKIDGKAEKLLADFMKRTKRSK
jgi:DnaJ-class molecular chaperone